MFMPWTDDLLTGIRTVDLQHKQLVGCANQLHEELSKADPDHRAVGEILLNLIEHTYNHFLTEEELFQRVLYSEATVHIAEHNSFTKTITALLELHESGERISTESLHLLKHWLVHHIVTLDKAYVPVLVSKGARYL